jgi:arylsulfatase
LWKNEEKVELDNEVIAPGTKLDEGADPYDLASYAKFTQKDYAPALMQKEVLSFIERNKDKPFFLYYATPIPHDPLQAPKRWVDHYVKKFGDEEPYLGDKGYFPNRYPHATYAAMISYLDEQVGELIAKLKELGIYDNTLIIFTSDNGPTYAGGVDAPFFNSAKPFNCTYGWTKGFVHEGGIRVPMIAAWKNHIRPGTTSKLISAFWDVMPTFAEVTGAEIPVRIDGISFLPALTGKGKQKEHDYLYWEFPSYGGQQAVRQGDWKAIRKDILKDNMAIELYNLKEDIVEEHNVAEDHPGIVEDMRTMMEDAHVQAKTVKFRMKQLGDTIPE